VDLPPGGTPGLFKESFDQAQFYPYDFMTYLERFLGLFLSADCHTTQICERIFFMYAVLLRLFSNG